MELSDDQCLYLRTVFDHFRGHGEWPTHKYLEHRFYQTHPDIDIEEVAQSLPSGLTNPVNLRDVGSKATLTVSAMYQICGPVQELDAFVRVIELCVDTYFETLDGSPRVSSSDVARYNPGRELTIRKVGLLLLGEPSIWSSFAGPDKEGSWSCEITKDIRRFRGVKTIEQYLEKRDQHRMPSQDSSFIPEQPHQDTNEVPPASEKLYAYDVALSFAGEDRIHAVALADALHRRKIKVFYDKYEKTTLWGKDLYTHLTDLYQRKARYCVMFFSQYYIAKAWTRHELKAAQARALNENEEYILPIRLDNTEIPGILQTTAYLDWHEETPESVAEALLEKLGGVPQVLLISERSIMDWLIEEVRLSNGRVGVDLGDVPGVKHFMSMEKDSEAWEAWYGTWFQQDFTERMGFEPAEESIAYALEKYAEIAE